MASPVDYDMARNKLFHKNLHYLQLFCFGTQGERVKTKQRS